MPQRLSAQKHSGIIKEAAEHATGRLSAIFHAPVALDSVEIIEGTLEEIFSGAGGLEKPVVGATFVCKEPERYFLFSFAPETAFRVIQLLSTQAAGKIPDFDTEYSQSIITEVGNMFVSSFMGSLSDQMGEEATIGAPGFVDDMLGAVVDGLVGSLARKAKQILKMDVALSSRTVEIGARLLVFSL